MKNLISVAIAVLTAVILSYLGNRRLYRTLGARAIVLGVPVWEESCKALAILVLPTSPVLLVHFLFGAVEFVLSPPVDSKLGKVLGALSLATHGLIGTLVFMVVALGHNHWLGYFLAVGIHLGLNAFVVRKVLPGLVWGESRQEG